MRERRGETDGQTVTHRDKQTRQTEKTDRQDRQRVVGQLDLGGINAKGLSWSAKGDGSY